MFDKLFRKNLGAEGEETAVSYLKKQGYKIIERNYRDIFGEADIIAEKDEFIVFIEVKTRLSDKFGAPSEAVDSKKQWRYRKLAEHYTLTKAKNKQVRFDVIEIFRDNLNHIEDAFI